MTRPYLLLPLVLAFTAAQAPAQTNDPAANPARLLRSDLDIDEAICEYGLQNGQFDHPADCVRYMQEKRLELARRFNQVNHQSDYQITYREWVYYRPDSVDLCTYGGCTSLVQGTSLDNAALDRARRQAPNGEIRPMDDSSAFAQERRNLQAAPPPTSRTRPTPAATPGFHDTYRWGDDDRNRRSRRHDPPSSSARPSGPPSVAPIPMPVNRSAPPPPPPPPPKPAEPSKPPEDDKSPLNVTRQPIRR